MPYAIASKKWTLLPEATDHALLFLRLSGTMDLSEFQILTGTRHPWEIARTIALQDLLKQSAIKTDNARILDIGCGDGYAADKLFSGDTTSIDAVDTSLTRNLSPHSTNSTILFPFTIQQKTFKIGSMTSSPCLMLLNIPKMTVPFFPKFQVSPYPADFYF